MERYLTEKERKEKYQRELEILIITPLAAPRKSIIHGTFYDKTVAISYQLAHATTLIIKTQDHVRMTA